jgi:DNA-binding HxlR family transcriptional regulator
MENKFINLTSVTYGLLEFFPEEEPLTNRAKDKALAISEGLVLFQENQASNKILEDIDTFLNYMEIAKSLGWMSNINFLIISKEYGKIRNQISQLVVKPPVERKKENTSIVAVQSPKDTSAPKLLVSDRQKKILNILKEKGKAQVSDFKTVLTDVTKRTIRRDLDELLKNNQIIRVGEWNQVFYQIGQEYVLTN